MQNFSSRLMGFIGLGVFLVILVAGLILLSYLLIFGAMVGLILFSAIWLKEKLFPTKQITRVKKRDSQIIDHDDL